LRCDAFVRVSQNRIRHGWPQTRDAIAVRTMNMHITTRNTFSLRNPLLIDLRKSLHNHLRIHNAICSAIHCALHDSTGVAKHHAVTPPAKPALTAIVLLISMHGVLLIVSN